MWVGPLGHSHTEIRFCCFKSLKIRLRFWASTSAIINNITNKLHAAKVSWMITSRYKTLSLFIYYLFIYYFHNKDYTSITLYKDVARGPQKTTRLVRGGPLVTIILSNRTITTHNNGQYKTHYRYSRKSKTSGLFQGY